MILIWYIVHVHFILIVILFCFSFIESASLPVVYNPLSLHTFHVHSTLTFWYLTFGPSLFQTMFSRGNVRLIQSSFLGLMWLYFLRHIYLYFVFSKNKLLFKLFFIAFVFFIWSELITVNISVGLNCWASIACLSKRH